MPRGVCVCRGRGGGGGGTSNEDHNICFRAEIIESNFIGFNIFGTIEICSTHG